jgi:hypothetical protein
VDKINRNSSSNAMSLWDLVRLGTTTKGGYRNGGLRLFSNQDSACSALKLTPYQRDKEGAH